MTILLINYEYPPIGAGAAKATRHIAKALVELGHNAVVLTAGFRDAVGHSIEDGGVHVYRLPSRRASISQSNPREMMSFVWHAWKGLDRVITEHRPDAAVIFFSIPCGVLGLRLRRRYRVPYIVSLRGGDVPGLVPELDGIHRILRSLRRRILQRAVAVVANSRGLAALSKKHDPQPVAVIHNGVDSDFMRPAAHAKNAHTELSLLFVGRLQPQKNLVKVFEAMARLKSAGAITLTIVGEGPQSAELHAQAKSLGVDGSITWLPWQTKEHLRELYQRADVLINYSLYEGMPNVVAEAMACGVPVIVSNIMGHDELVEHGRSGLIVNLDDADGLDAALASLMLDQERRAALGHAARQRMTQDFSWKKTADEYVRLFQQRGTLGVNKEA
ncbi:MAG: glycosyltransferase family 4 protein [Candidatus Kapaibacterium sp.]